MTARVLNRRQASWNMSLSRFDFVITYWPRKQQELSDALSRRSYLVPKEGEAAYEQQRTTLLKAEQLRLRAATMSTPVDRVVILGVRRPFGGRTGWVGGPVHYALYEPGEIL
jgi:hypothetical protein